VEIWFGIFTRKALAGASFRSAEQLTRAIHEFTAAYNERAAPFVWRKREVKGAQLPPYYRKLTQLDTSSCHKLIDISHVISPRVLHSDLG
jgi:hypothetical protein